jgi:hypothetical protein
MSSPTLVLLRLTDIVTFAPRHINQRAIFIDTNVSRNSRSRYATLLRLRGFGFALL